MKRLAVLFIFCGLGGAVSMEAASPSWWVNSGLIDPTASHAASENYFPVNQGQLKNFARKAKAHMDANLSGGAGSAIDAMVAGFGTNLTSTQKAEQYQILNIGQLKAIAKPFYDRLLNAGYDTKQNVIDHGATGWAYDYPWNPVTPASENYAPANLGQMKMAFSFDVSGLAFSSLADADHDGLPDWWESLVGGTPGNALGDANGNGIKNVTELVLDNGSPNVTDVTEMNLSIFTTLY